MSDVMWIRPYFDHPDPEPILRDVFDGWTLGNGIFNYLSAITPLPWKDVETVDEAGCQTYRPIPVGRLPEYKRAFAITIHKSQGAQYKSVIMNLQCAHAIMLIRAIVYTAITRARLRLMIVGERKALCRAIRNTKADQRGTRLARRIQDFLQ